jgi:hypothetical protein
MAHNPEDNDSNGTPEDDNLKSFDELKGMSPEDVQTELQRYHKAFEEEFEKSQEDNSENVHENTQRFFQRNLPHFLAQIVFLSQNAESESVRASMSKFGIQEALKAAEKEGDPVKQLISQLQGEKAEASEIELP